MKPSITGSDAYKFPMAEAGAALREETFYYSHRRGGWHYMPVDPAIYVQSLLPEATKEDYDYLTGHAYEVGASFRKAFAEPKVEVKGVPKGSWFYDREPAFSVKGASAVSSWLEPNALMLNFRIQIATAVKLGKFDFERVKFATCEREREIVLETLDSVGFKPPAKIEVKERAYYDWVKTRAKELLDVVKDPNRIFEVGLRAVSCMEQHEIALSALKEAGIIRTSNAYLAQKLGMIPVGTMGHEHPQRMGDDYASYIAMRDRFPGFLFYLPDTYSTLRSGIPSALTVIAEQPERDAGIRFDSESGIRGHYMFTVARSIEMGLQPRLALESGWNLELTKEFEQLREMVRWPADRQAYGYGGYLVQPPWGGFRRDDVQAVYKLSRSGVMPTMKFGDEPSGGKQSIPGEPVIWRPSPLNANDTTPAGYVLQAGEDWRPPVPSTILSGSGGYKMLEPIRNLNPIVLSPATNELIRQCQERKTRVIAEAALRGGF